MTVSNSSARILRLAVAAIVVTTLSVGTGFYVIRKPEPVTIASPTSTLDPADDKSPQTGGVPLFTGWPKEQTPDVVLVVSGQTYGYLSPCGCSRPQKGGLERRANFIDTLKAKGWPVVGLDVGDVAPPKGVQKQNLLKYRFTMKALAEMGYMAVGVGEYDFANQLFELLAEFPLNNPNKPPFILAGNLVGVIRDNAGNPTKEFSREEYFPGGPNSRPMVGGYEVITVGKLAIGVVGVIGPTVAKKILAHDKQFDFQKNIDLLPDVLAKLDKQPTKPSLRVLLYQGTLEEAKTVSEKFPQFQVIVCLSDESEPPQFPTQANGGKTAIVQVGHKGQSVGSLGIFKTANGFDLRYQLIPLGEEYLTPDNPAAEKANKTLQLLEEYSAEVKKQNLLAQFVAKPLQHQAQIQHPDAKLTYVGADECRKCHAAEYAVWRQTKHPEAYVALEKLAKRPANRQFDGECLSCHTTGFEYAGGFRNVAASPNLLGNQCENCHGPGSGHSAKPNDKALLAALAPWKTQPTDKLPDLATMKKLAAMKPIERGAVKLPANQIQMVNAVSGMCMKCHDGENDPKFDFYEYFPKIYHSGLKSAGLPAGAK